MTYIYLLAGLIPVAILVGIIYIWSKKENEKIEKVASQLTEEQKNKLMDNQVENFNEKKITWTQRGMISEVKESGSKVKVRVLYYNTVVQNNTLNQICATDLKADKSEFEKHGLKVGSFVKIFIDMNKFESNIVFE